MTKLLAIESLVKSLNSVGLYLDISSISSSSNSNNSSKLMMSGLLRILFFYIKNNSLPFLRADQSVIEVILQQPFQIN